MAQGYLAPAQWIRHKVTFTASEVKNCNTTPVTMLSPQGSGKIIIVDPFSIVMKHSSGTAFSFSVGSVFIGDPSFGNIYASMNNVDFSSDDWLTGGFIYNYTVNDQGIFLTNGCENNGIYLMSESNSAVGTRIVTISYNYCVLNLN